MGKDLLRFCQFSQALWRAVAGNFTLNLSMGAGGMPSQCT